MIDIDLKKFFLRTLIAALCVSALIGIVVFLIGDFGETELRLLLTTLATGGFSLTGLCCATIQDREDLRSYSLLGVAASALGFLVTLCVIWEIIDAEKIWKLMAVLIIVAVALAHVSLLLLIKPKKQIVKNILLATICCVAILAVMLIVSTLIDFDLPEFYFRLLGVVAILDVLGTIATPVVNRMAD